MNTEIAPWIDNPSWKLGNATAVDFYWIKVYTREWLPYRAKEHRRYSNFLRLIRYETELEEELESAKSRANAEISIIERGLGWSRWCAYLGEDMNERERNKQKELAEAIAPIVAWLKRQESDLRARYVKLMAEISLDG